MKATQNKRARSSTAGQHKASVIKPGKDLDRPATGRQDPSLARTARPERMPRTGSKQVIVLDHLQRPQGATLDELVAATGWLPHTTRAALTGFRKRGFELERSKGEDGRSSYRITHSAKVGGGSPNADREA
jgi:Protein of unknown function (DUF3489)